MRRISFAALAALAGLTACGDEVSGSIGLRIYDLLAERFSGETPAPVAVPGYTPAEVAANPQDYLFVRVPSLGVNEPARLIGANGAELTWQGMSGQSYAFDDGVLVATRGFMGDLLVLSSAGVRESLRAGGGGYSRTLERLDSLDQLSTVTLNCAITPNGPESVNLGARQAVLTKYTESCSSTEIAFENAYWLDGAGRIVQSRQLVSASTGYVIANDL